MTSEPTTSEPTTSEPTTSEPTIRHQLDDHVATVWLHRPHRHNAWTGRMHAEYRSAMDTLERDPEVRVVVVSGTPPAFCVGGDSQALADHAERGSYDTGLPPEPARPGRRMRPEYDDDFAWMMAYRTPIIAAVNGAAAGIGLALALFCDLRFGAAPAKLTTAAPKLGLPAEYGTSWILPRLIGATRAADLILSGRVVTVAETESWGLWNGVTADGDGAYAAAVDYARLLVTSTGPAAVSTAKAQLYHDLHRHDAAGSVADSKRLLDEAMSTAEYREGVAALREKRPPRF
jgi:enoyl-CoA hydratase/carnithine racemase